MLGNLFEKRAISFQTVWGAGDDGNVTNLAGTTINSGTAFEIVAFFSAVSLISDTISTLPLDAFIRRDGERYPYRPKPVWVDQPDIDATRQAHYQQVLVSLMTNGNSYTRIWRDKTGEIVNLTVLNPELVDVKRTALGRKLFVIKGEKKTLNSEDIIHLTDLLEPGQIVGMSRIAKLNNALGVAAALQSYAATFFGNGATTAGIIEVPTMLTEDQSKMLQKGFDSRHSGWRKAHKTGILHGGAHYVDTTVANDSAQFLESRRFAVEEMARAFNIPLHMMGIPDTASYASVEQNAIQFVTHTLRPYIEKIEWGYTRLLPNNAYIKFNVDGLLRGDFNSRISAYSVGLQSGFMSVNDVRKLEDMRSVEGGDQYRVPLANIDLKATNVVELQNRVAMATKLIQVGFEPEAALTALGLPTIDHTGVPNVQLQPVSGINPENPDTVYGVN